MYKISDTFHIAIEGVDPKDHNLEDFKNKGQHRLSKTQCMYPERFWLTVIPVIEAMLTKVNSDNFIIELVLIKIHSNNLISNAACLHIGIISLLWI